MHPTMKLFALAVLSQVCLGFCQQLSSGTAACCTIIMADEHDIAEDLDSPTEMQIVPAEEASGSGRSRSTRPAESQRPMCFLCGEGLPNSSIVKYQGMDLHQECALACRAHWRLLDEEEREVDKKFKETNPEEWKPLVFELVIKPGEKRNIKVHRERLLHITAFNETSSNKEIVLLTKRRYKQVKKFWDG